MTVLSNIKNARWLPVPLRTDGLQNLYQRIIQRKTASPSKSYTAQLLAGGVAACSAKVMEEAQELVAAAQNENDKALAHEAADLIYHINVLLAARNVSFDVVLDALVEREAQSGLAEKASRSKSA